MAVGFSAASLFFFATTSLCAIAAPHSSRTPPWNSWVSPQSGMPPSWPYGGPPAGGMPPGWPYRGPPASVGGSCSCSSSNSPPLPPPKEIMVGDKNKWSFGTNYADWVTKAGTFYVNDVLEFDYPLPVDGRAFNHSVHLLKDYASFQSCDLSGSVRVGNEYAGGAPGGFKFQLGMKLPSDPYYYFACGEKHGFHCDKGTMKFAVMPIPRWG